MDWVPSESGNSMVTEYFGNFYLGGITEVE